MRTLTADDVTALRTMDKVVVNIKDDSATIRVIKTMPARKGYPATESEREILADANSRGTTACFVTLFPRGEWRALALLAHAGDRLIFRVADNQNSYLRAAVVPAANLDSPQYHTDYAGLHHDELYVSIVRDRGTNGSSRPTTILRDLTLASSICPDNSARAIKSSPAHYSLA